MPLNHEVPLLQVENLKKYYSAKSGMFSRSSGEIRAVDGVSFSLYKGEPLGLVGESGCGKSITCSSIMGLLSFPLSLGQGSSIRFQQGDGREVEITGLSKAELRKLRGRDISMIFQEPMTSLNPIVKCGKQIAESLRLHHRGTNLRISSLSRQPEQGGNA